MKRIVLFLATNLAVLLVLSVVAHLLGLDVWLAQRGSSLSGLLVWAALFANGDMVTLTLVQGVVNTFVLLLSRVVGNIIDRAVFRSEDGRGFASVLVFYALQIVFGILATPLVMWFSRWREFRADRGGAELA